MTTRKNGIAALLRLALRELRAVRTGVVVAMLLVLASWLLVAKLQEPIALRRTALVFGGSARSALLAALVTLPWLWHLSRGGGAVRWQLHWSRRVGGLVLPPALGVAMLGWLVLMIALALIYTVDRIIGPTPGLLGPIGAGAALAWAPMAALAPALPLSGLGIIPLSLVWAALVVASCRWGVPFPLGSVLIPPEPHHTMAYPGADAHLASLLGCLAALATSCGVARWRLGS